MRKPSLKRKLLVHLAVAVLFQSFLFYLISYFQLDYRVWLPVSSVLTLLLLIVAINWFLAPIGRIVTALETGVSGIIDNDFSITIHNEEFEELASIIDVYNGLSKVLREKRLELMQKELLLDKIVQSTPVAMILTNDADQIVYSNSAARTLLNSPRLEGHTFEKPDQGHTRGNATGDAGTARWIVHGVPSWRNGGLQSKLPDISAAKPAAPPISVQKPDH